MPDVTVHSPTVEDVAQPGEKVLHRHGQPPAAGRFSCITCSEGCAYRDFFDARPPIIDAAEQNRLARGQDNR